MCWNSLGVVVYSVVFGALLDFEPSGVLANVTIYANYDFGDRFIVGDYEVQLILNCNIRGTQDPKYIWKWFKGDNQITTDSEIPPHHVNVSGNTLIIDRFVENDASTYTCSLFSSSKSPTAMGHMEFYVLMKPFLELSSYSNAFIEGEKMELECIVHGYPTPKVGWKFENTKLVPSERIKFLPNKNNISNAILVLDPITMNDTGNYFCTGYNRAVFEPSESYAAYVRIKAESTDVVWPHYDHPSSSNEFSNGGHCASSSLSVNLRRLYANIILSVEIVTK